MTEKEKVLLLSYLYNNLCRLESELHQLQANVRFRNIDVTDCMELICASQQLQTFREVSDHIIILLKLDKQ